MSDLAAIVDLVEADLMDSSNAYWSSGEIEANIRRALYDYNRVAPRRAFIKLDTTADTREYSLAGITGIKDVLQVHYPYNAADPVYPPAFVSWTRFEVAGVDTLRLEVATPPSGDDTDDVRLLYTLGHTIEDLDSATATTLDAEGESVIILGATAFAATQLAQSTIGTVTATRMSPAQYQAWAYDRHTAFQIALHNLRRRADGLPDARTRPVQDSLL